MQGAYPLMKGIITKELGDNVDAMVSTVKSSWSGAHEQEIAANWLASLPAIANGNLAEGDELHGMLAAVGAEMVGLLAEPKGSDAGKTGKQQDVAGRILITAYPYARQELQPVVKAAHEKLMKELGDAEGITPRWQAAVTAVTTMFVATSDMQIRSGLETLWANEFSRLRFARAQKNAARADMICSRITFMHNAFAGAGVHDEQRIRVLEVIKSLPLEEEHELKPSEAVELRLEPAPAVARTGLAGAWDRYVAWMDKQLGYKPPSR
jgi:hypothetical protein